MLKLIRILSAACLIVACYSNISAACDLSHEILQKICNSECAGPGTKVTPWLNKKDDVKYYSFTGSLSVCSHPPQIFFDPDGNRKFVLPERPVEKVKVVKNEKLKNLHQSSHSISCEEKKK